MSSVLLLHLNGVMALIKKRKGKIGSSQLVPATRKRRERLTWTIYVNAGSPVTFHVFKTGRVWYWTNKGRIILRKKHALPIRKYLMHTELYTDFLGRYKHGR